MMEQIRDEVQACIPCQQYNVGKKGFHPAHYPTITLPWDHLIIDLVKIVPTPKTSAYALVIIDVFTNFIIIRPLANIQGEDIARELHTIFAILGPPKVLQSDRGSHFLNQIMPAFTHLHQIRHKFASAYHPQTNGKVEKVIGVIRTILNKLMRGDYTEWPYYCDAVQYYYNNKINEITQSTPFSLMFGRRANKYDNYELAVAKPITQQQWYEFQQKIISLVYPTITSKYNKLKAQQVEKYKQLKRKILLDTLPPGTQVSIRNIKATSKLDPRYLTGYVVIRRTSHGPYILRTPEGAVYDRTVPIDQIKPLRRLPLRTGDDDDRQYVVEKILDHSNENADGTKQRQYLVKWLGYTQPTWQPLEDLEHCTQLIKEYWDEVSAREQSGRPR
jgi:hypothetical protein